MTIAIGNSVIISAVPAKITKLVKTAVFCAVLVYVLISVVLDNNGIPLTEQCIIFYVGTEHIITRLLHAAVQLTDAQSLSSVCSLPMLTRGVTFKVA